MDRAPGDGAITGRCHCGSVSLRLAHPPTLVSECNCSLCAKLGLRGAYYASDEVEVTGELDSYTRTDISEPKLALHRCRTCGCATHWTPLTPPPHKRMGINARMLDETVLEGAELVQVDGRSRPL